jgi:hypothetical protein
VSIRAGWRKDLEKISIAQVSQPSIIINPFVLLRFNIPTAYSPGLCMERESRKEEASFREKQAQIGTKDISLGRGGTGGRVGRVYRRGRGGSAG